MSRDSRMYESKYPEVDDVVMVQARAPQTPQRPPIRRESSQQPGQAAVAPPAEAAATSARAGAEQAALARPQVKSIAEMGAYVSLLEYNNIEGMILLSELSRRRIRSVTKLIKARSPSTRAANPRLGDAGLACCCAARVSAPALTLLFAACRQVGRVEPVMVLRVDKDKGYIDLSKR
jgi:hypothetical protein